MTTTLESNFEIIFKHLTVDEIFLWTYNSNGISQTIVQVHTHNKQRSRNLRERCERAMHKIEAHQFRFYNTKDVQARINDGFGRLHLNCNPENRIYLNPEHFNSVSLPNLETKKLLEQTATYIKREKDKIIAFMEGYQLYYDKENYPNAAFMLHQALEISLRTAQKLLVGIEYRSHSLKQNIDFFKPYDTLFAGLMTSKEEEQSINRLTEAYTGSRYKNDFTMDLQQMQFCKNIAAHTLARIADYEQELLSEIEEKHNSNANKTTIMEKKTNISHDHRDLIHNALETYGKVHGLYCFAYVTRQDSMCNLLNVQQTHHEIHHYYLFAIMSNQNRPIMDLQNCVMQLLPEKIKITLIAETPEQVEKKLKKGDRFRSNLLQSAECWYRDREFVEVDEVAQKIDFENARKHWDQRHSNAIDINFAIAQSFDDLNQETKAYLYALTVEQLCLGLISLHFHFTPGTNNLNYLMNLCDIICPEITIIFHREIPIQKQQFNLLIEAQNNFRHNPSYSAKDIHWENLDEQILSFFEEIGDFVKTYFERHNERENHKTENIEQCT